MCLQIAQVYISLASLAISYQLYVKYRLQVYKYIELYIVIVIAIATVIAIFIKEQLDTSWILVCQILCWIVVGYLLDFFLEYLLVVRVCVCVCVCACLFIFFHRGGFFRLQNVLDILEGTNQRSCVVNISWLRYAKFHHLRI